MLYIGIVTYNSIHDLPACFVGLEKQTYPSIRVIVLDNASVDGSPDWIVQHQPACELIRNSENVGFGRGHNLIVQHIKLQDDDFYMPLNPDVELDPGYIQTIIDEMQRVDAGWASGKLLEKDVNGKLTGRIYSAGQGIRRDGFVINIGEAMPDNGHFDAAREVFIVSGAAPIFRHALIKSISDNGDFFDSSMFMYGEDIDVGWRARLQGWSCWYVPSGVAYHRGGKVQGWMRAQALGNLFLSTLKNAFIQDLIFYNSPRMAMSWLAHSIVHPDRGIQIARQILLNVPRTWRKRGTPKVSRAEMLKWFQWSGEQLTGQPTTLRQRVTKYIKCLSTNQERD